MATEMESGRDRGSHGEESPRLPKELAARGERLQELMNAGTVELREMNRRLQSQIEERELKEEELQVAAEQLRSLSQRMETIRESERARFAARIHDSFEQSLAIIKMQMKNLERKLPEKAEKGGELERIYDTIDHFLDEVQGVSEELRPSVLNDAGLVAAMEWRTKELESKMGIDTSFRGDLEGVIFTDVLSTFVYRVFQEAVENAVRHSETLVIRTDLSIEDGVLTLRIIDEGRGISQDELEDPESLGLLWMNERAKYFGGNIDIVGRADRGTEVTLRVPVSRS